FALPLSSPALAAEPEVPTAPLITTGTVWNYLDDNTDPAAGATSTDAWTTPEFDDSVWSQAPSGFGVKNNALADIGPYPTATKLNHYIDGTKKPTVPTYFFRTSFTIDPGVTELLGSASATIVYDDAVRVYVNGER